MITDNDIKRLKAVFATKDDLKRFATKDDLKRFATKDDLKRFATKDDLGKVQGVVNNLVGEVVGVKQRLDIIEEKMVTKDDMRGVMTRMDNLFGEVKAMREEQTVHYQEHEDNRLEHAEIKERIKKLESSRGFLGNT